MSTMRRRAIPVTCPICQGPHYASTCTSKADALAARAAGGDTAALGELFAALQYTVLDLVADRLPGRFGVHAEDAAQDVWVEVCEWIGLVEPEGFVAWLVMLVDEVAERYLPRPAPVAAAPKAAKKSGRIPNPFASPLRLAGLRLAVSAA
ncbi:sigma-70 family RNA polymerase sigma factor [Glycomyces artemisiae]|uniref:Uncharacterized protein n=1 Tax=Glycomyces artemisiae TaxID=1076443 RepID=A0A2T0U6J8_9ACTN|nr:sigma-70 family RNA polymerase sigma factor [Glycomyces artemisiae]PRY53524.1 hypothetical protein B0I28_11723 [Glycomyces artemisiae]